MFFCVGQILEQFYKGVYFNEILQMIKKIFYDFVQLFLSIGNFRKVWYGQDIFIELLLKIKFSFDKVNGNVVIDVFFYVYENNIVRCMIYFVLQRIVDLLVCFFSVLDFSGAYSFCFFYFFREM